MPVNQAVAVDFLDTEEQLTQNQPRVIESERHLIRSEALQDVPQGTTSEVLHNYVELSLVSKALVDLAKMLERPRFVGLQCQCQIILRN